MREIKVSLLVLLLLASVPYTIYGQESKGHKRGDIAPNFNTITLAGDEVSLSDYRGKYVLLNFWGSWCQPCHTALPDLWEAYDTFSEDDFEIIGIALERNEQSANRFIESYEIKWPNVVELMDSEKPITESYNVQGYPLYYLIDRDGKIAEFGGGRFFTSRLVEIMNFYIDY